MSTLQITAIVLRFINLTLIIFGCKFLFEYFKVDPTIALLIMLVWILFFVPGFLTSNVMFLDLIDRRKK